jgi:heme exporter protein A
MRDRSLLEAVNLSCARGDRTLFRGISFAVEPGQLLHIKGRNGCGKTTLLRTLCGLTRPDEGEVRWRGNNTRTLGDDYRAELAYLGHRDGVQGELSALENLRTAAALANGDVAKAPAALDQVGLSPYGDFPAKLLSQGQRRRLAFARLLTLDRPLWILDEPLSALDTDSVEAATAQLTAHLKRGGAIVLTSHQPIPVAPLPRSLSLDSP